MKMQMTWSDQPQAIFDSQLAGAFQGHCGQASPPWWLWGSSSRPRRLFLGRQEVQAVSARVEAICDCAG